MRWRHNGLLDETRIGHFQSGHATGYDAPSTYGGRDENALWSGRRTDQRATSRYQRAAGLRGGATAPTAREHLAGHSIRDA
jgi:hypothetical protein